MYVQYNCIYDTINKNKFERGNFRNKQWNLKNIIITLLF